MVAVSAKCWSAGIDEATCGIFTGEATGGGLVVSVKCLLAGVDVARGIGVFTGEATWGGPVVSLKRWLADTSAGGIWVFTIEATCGELVVPTSEIEKQHKALTNVCVGFVELSVNTKHIVTSL